MSHKLCCPFCGSSDNLSVRREDDSAWVYCGNCGAEGPPALGDDCVCLAETLWNTRSARTDLREVLHEVNLQLCWLSFETTLISTKSELLEQLGKVGKTLLDFEHRLQEVACDVGEDSATPVAVDPPFELGGML